MKVCVSDTCLARSNQQFKPHGDPCRHREVLDEARLFYGGSPFLDLFFSRQARVMASTIPSTLFLGDQSVMRSRALLPIRLRRSRDDIISRSSPLSAPTSPTG